MRAFALIAFLLALPATAFAADGFAIVVPGRPGVPIIINGIDASYAVVEGDWGLAKGVHVQPTIYGGRYIAERQPADVGHYYPSLGLRPGYGRLEIEPPADRKLPKPAESYHQFWGAQSMPLPADTTPQPEVPPYPPPVILAPRGDDDIRNRFDSPPQDFHRKQEALPN